MSAKRFDTPPPPPAGGGGGGGGGYTSFEGGKAPALRIQTLLDLTILLLKMTFSVGTFL